jgi:hypothetical protein
MRAASSWTSGVRAFQIGINAQLQFLPERHQTKHDPTGPQFGDGTFSQIVVDEWEDGTVDIVTGEPIPESEGLQTNNPGWPGFASNGLLAGGGVTLTLLY